MQRLALPELSSTDLNTLASCRAMDCTLNARRLEVMVILFGKDAKAVI